MATELKLRRGTTAQHSTFTGAEAEVTVDTTKDTIVVHDGTTAGGHPLAKESGGAFTGNISVTKSGSNAVVGAERTSAAVAGKVELISGDSTNALLSYGTKGLVIGTDGAEDFRVGPSGQLGVNGENYGTAGQVLTSGGASARPSWADVAGFPTGTRMSFQQTAAPTGWTKDTTAAINDAVIRLVTGTASSGGSLAFSTFAANTATGGYTLATADIPSHSHPARSQSTSNSAQSGGTSAYINSTLVNTSATGGGGSHSHSLAQNLKYYDFIIASKN
jgi:hypothetical protein